MQERTQELSSCANDIGEVQGPGPVQGRLNEQNCTSRKTARIPRVE